MAGTSPISNQERIRQTSSSSTSSTSKSSSPSKSESSSNERQSSSVNKVDVNSSKSSYAAKRISDSQISEGKFKATSETSVGALAQKINDDGKGNVDSDSVKSSVRNIVDNNPELKKAASELDPNDPEYDQKLADLKIKEGEEVSLPSSSEDDTSTQKSESSKKASKDKKDAAEDSGSSEDSGESGGCSSGSGGCGSSKGSDKGSASDGASGSEGVQGKQSDSSSDPITELIQAAIQAITSKDKDSATKILELIKGLIEQLQNALGGQSASKPSDNTQKSVDKINSGSDLASEDTSKISDILKNSPPSDKIAVLEALSHRLEGIANQSDTSKADSKKSDSSKSSSDPLTDSLNSQANYNMASINIGNTKNKLSNIKVSGNAQVTIA